MIRRRTADHREVPHRGQPLAHVVAGEIRLLLAERARLAGPGVQRARQGRAEAGDVRPAVHGVDVVREGDHVLGEPVVVLERHLDVRRVDEPLDIDRTAVQHVTPPVQVAHEARHAALEEEVLLAVDPLVAQADPEPLVQVRRLAQARRDRLPAEVEGLEHLGIGLEEAACAVLPLPAVVESAVRLGHPAGLLDRSLRHATNELLHVPLPVAQDLDAHLGTQRVHDAHADPVEAARDLVAAATELPAGVEDGHDDLERALAGRMAVDRDATAVVHHLAAAIGMDRDVDPRRLVGHRLVDAVVDDLPHELMQATRIGRADVHARALADRLQALENLDVRGGVAALRLAAGLRCSFDGHTVEATSWSGWTDAASPAVEPPAPRVMIE